MAGQRAGLANVRGQSLPHASDHPPNRLQVKFGATRTRDAPERTPQRL